MKLTFRSLAALAVLLLAACGAPTPTAPAAAPSAPSLDVGTQTDTTSRGPNLFGSGN